MTTKKPYADHSEPSEKTDKPFTAFDTQTCLYDVKRVEYFRQALFGVVRPGDVVVDGGSGTGVLGMIAAQAGAAKVYCIELNAEYAQVIRNNAIENHMQDKIVVIEGDATKVELPEQVDVIISETINGGFFYEPQIQVVNNLLRFLKQDGRVVPSAIDEFVELVHAQDVLYGLTFRNDTRHIALDDISFTTKRKYLTADFYKKNPTNINTTATVRGMTSGTANAIRVPYIVHFSDDVIGTEPTDFLLNPQIIFLKEPIQVKAGDYYEISLSYTAASSPLACKVTVRSVA